MPMTALREILTAATALTIELTWCFGLLPAATIRARRGNRTGGAS